MRWFHRNKKAIYLVIIGVFVLGTFAGFGSYFVDHSPMDAAVVVGERQIPYRRYQAIYERALAQRGNASAEPVTDAERRTLRQQVVRALVEEAVFLDEADRYGVTVTDNELSQLIQSVPQFQTDNKFDPARYQQALAQVRLSVRDFEEEQRQQVRVQKTQFIMASGVKISPLEFNGQFRGALTQAKPAERKQLLANPEGFREQLRSREIQASFQDWYEAVNTRLKVRVQLDKIEGKS